MPHSTTGVLAAAALAALGIATRDLVWRSRLRGRETRPYRAASLRRAAAAVGVTLLTGAAASPPAAAAGWARDDLEPITQPAPVGSRFVVYVEVAGGVRLLGLDAATGRTIWSLDASSSDIAPGQAPYVTIAGGAVIYLAAAEGGAAAVAAADAETGAPLWRSLDGFFTGSPAPCMDQPTVICVTGSLLSPYGETREMRFDAGTGRPLAARTIRGLREVAWGLFDLGERDPERLVATRDARRTWSRPIARVFATGASTDWGWNIDRIEPLGLFVGSVGWPPRRSRGRLRFDLAKTMTAGFRIADGVTRWRRPGHYSCTTLPCPGASQAGYQLAGAPAGVPEVGLRVVTRGTLSYAADPSDDSAPSASRDAFATIQGFTFRTGRTRWNFDAGRNMSLIAGTAAYAFTDNGSIAIRDARGRLRALDLVRGVHRAVSSTTSGWCRRAEEYRQDTPYETDDGPIRTHSGQPSLFPCTVGTRRARGTPAQVPRFVGEIGARNAELIAWSAPSAVLAAEPAAR